MHLPRVLRTSLAGLLRTLPAGGRRFGPAFNRLFPAETVEVGLGPVGRLHLDLGDDDQVRVFWAGLGDDDRRVIALLRWALPADGVFLDVGPGIGVHTLAAARHVAAGGSVVAFEPCPRRYQALLLNLALNHLHHVVAHPVGLAGEAGEGPEGRRLRLDDFLEDHPVPRIDMMRIDAGGAELRVLRGAREAVARFRPALVVAVCPGRLRRHGVGPAELLSTLESLGYAVRRLSGDGNEGRVSAGDLNGMRPEGRVDVVALPVARRARAVVDAGRREKVVL
jgi:hypothetical protein